MTPCSRSILLCDTTRSRLLRYSVSLLLGADFLNTLQHRVKTVLDLNRHLHAVSVYVTVVTMPTTNINVSNMSARRQKFFLFSIRKIMRNSLTVEDCSVNVFPGLACSSSENSSLKVKMSMEHRWNHTEWGRPRYWGKNLSQCHFVLHKSDIEWPGIKPGSP